MSFAARLAGLASASANSSLAKGGKALSSEASRLGVVSAAELARLYKPKPAIELQAEEAVREVHGRSVSCHGGSGALGHPRVWINLDKPGAHACGYCGIRYQQVHDHGHDHHGDAHAKHH